MAKRVMKVYDVYWGPTGQKIATVEASTAKAAKRKAPQPYRRYLREIYVEDRGPVKSNPRVGRALGAKSYSIPKRTKRADESGGTSIIYPSTSSSGKRAKGKTHHVKPRKKNPALRRAPRKSGWIKAKAVKFETRGGRRVVLVKN